MVLLLVRQGGWAAITVNKDTQGRVRNVSRKPGDLFKNRHSDSLKKSQPTLSQGMLQKGDVNDDADYGDEMGTTALS
jgi:hypothetical protein